MKRLSPNTAAFILIVAFATLGTAKLVRDYSSGRSLQVHLNAGFSHPVLLGGTPQTAFIKVDLTGFRIEREKERTPVNLALV
ncbi:MAG TPA: hypothetical protein VGA18_06700, partial [Rhodothermales bacterium]